MYAWDPAGDSFRTIISRNHVALGFETYSYVLHPWQEWLTKLTNLVNLMMGAKPDRGKSGRGRR